MNRVKVDIVDRLRNAGYLNQRPGTADSDVNVFALPVQITYGDLTLAILEIERLRSQLPDDMKHCTILFKECEKGHGRLTATNWVDHGCPHCENEKLRFRIEGLEGIETFINWRHAAWSVVNDITDWSSSADTGSTTIEPWGSPYAMNPENWT